MNLKSRPDRLKEFYSNKFPFRVQRIEAIKTNPGWVGCTQTQINILKKQTKFPFVIFEDDCQMLQSWDVVQNIMKQLPQNWDALYLGATLMKPQQRYSENLFRLIGGYCAHAIIYNSKQMVDYVLTHYQEFFNCTQERKTLDVFYFVEVQPMFNCFITDPLCATQRAGYSDIENMNVEYIQIAEHFKRFTDAG